MSNEVETIMKALDNLHRLTANQKAFVEKAADYSLKHQYTEREKRMLSSIRARLY